MQDHKLRLRENDVYMLQQVVAQGSRVYQQRAQAILLTSQGASIDDIAGQVQLTKRQILYWIRRYEQYGVDIFPDAGLAETPESVAPEPASLDTASNHSTRPVVPRRAAPGVNADDPMSEAGRKVLAFYFAALLEQETLVRDQSHAQAIHDLRVTIRHLRSALDIFGDFYHKKPLKSYRRELRRLARALGVARDLEVVRAHIEAYMAQDAERDNDALQPLIESWRQEESDARDLLVEVFDSRHYQKFIADFARFVTTPDLYANTYVGVDQPYLARHVAPVLIYQRYSELRAYESEIANASLDRLHDLRIAGKHLRYTLEAFEEILTSDARKVIRAVKALQTHLGNLQDARVAVDLIHDYFANAEPPEDGQTPSYVPIAQYMDAREAEKKRLYREVAEVWQDFNKAENKRALALSIADL